MVDEARASPPSGSPKPSSVGRHRAGPYWQPLLTAVDEAARARLVDPEAPCHRLGRFEVEELLGCGGMGIVLRARDPRLDREVALKLWNLEGEDAEAALLHEARCQARVTHPNVVTIYEAGKIAADVYLAMEYVDGLDLRRWLNARPRRWQQVLAAFVYAGRGLAAVHARGLVHADFKPENVLVDDRVGRVLVADFGVARVFAEHERERGSPTSGTSGRGTKVYMAPERLAGQGTDARSDQFSFCVSLWECMFGVRPFVGDTPEELLSTMRAGVVRISKTPRGLPSKLRKVLLEGLAVDPSDRHRGMDELVAALDDVPVVTRRRWLRVVQAVSLTSAGLIGAAVALRWEGAERSASERAIAHVKPGISTGPTPTAIEAPEASLPTILEAIEDNQLLPARDDWRTLYQAEDVAGRSPEVPTLVIANAFLARSRELAERDPALALKAARYANQCASWLLVRLDLTPEGAVTAEDISTEAAKQIVRLEPRAKQAQSKHSTVPSTLE